MKKKTLITIPIVLAVVFGAVLGYMKYSPNPMGVKLTFISHTEYQQGEAGQTIVRITNAFGIPQSNVQGCNVTIYYPDKTVFVDNQPMTQGGTAGSWYYQFTTPYNQVGEYEEYVQCAVTMPSGQTKLIGAGSAFHVSEALTLINQTASATARIIS